MTSPAQTTLNILEKLASIPPENVRPLQIPLPTISLTIKAIDIQHTLYNMGLLYIVGPNESPHSTSMETILSYTLTPSNIQPPEFHNKLLLSKKFTSSLNNNHQDISNKYHNIQIHRNRPTNRHIGNPPNRISIKPLNRVRHRIRNIYSLHPKTIISNNSQ